MAYNENVRDEIKKDVLKNLWKDICESYEQGGAEQIKSMLDGQGINIKKDYQEVIEKLGKMLSLGVYDVEA
ncbi:MAG: hypothetical protein AMJ89_03190 [candidate division Zixibacteria bacterium SM23_73]|nr:MAG: hypothetical protein AMJ89_03190 [candidate division Zixibacteria bacterium SM23_73]